MKRELPNMLILRTTCINSLIILFKSICLILINKIFAVYIGTNGYAAIGQMNNAITIMAAFSTAGLSLGLTRFTAKHKNDVTTQSQYWSNSLLIVLTCLLISTFILLSFAKPLSKLTLETDAYYLFFWAYILSLCCTAVGTLFQSILNGNEDYIKIFKINFFSSLFALSLCATLTPVYNLKGAILALIISPGLVGLTSIYYCFKTDWFKLANFTNSYNKNIIKELFGYTIMSLTSALVLPLSQFSIRTYTIDYLGLEYAGCWEAMVRISAIFLIFISSSLTLVYLPKLSQTTTAEDNRKLILKTITAIIPLTLIIVLFLSYFSHEIILLLFSSSFLPIKDIFSWHMFGDLVRTINFIVGFICTAKGLTKLYVFTEIAYGCLFFILSFLALNFFHFEGLGIAYLMNAIINLLILTYLLKRSKHI